jgi:hypothetical protein
VYDEDFKDSAVDYNKIEDGHCLKVTCHNGNCAIYQTLNYNGSITERLAGQTTYKVISLNATLIRPYVRVFSGTTSLVFAYVGSNFVNDGKRYCMSWTLPDNYMQLLDGQTITSIEYGVFIQGATDETVFEINHLLLTFSENLLPVYSWTNISTRDLISQINLAPEGVKIQGDKIDIYGLTTFHNSDGTGGTTIDGATITAGDMYWYKGETNEAHLTSGRQLIGGTWYYGVVVTGNLFAVKADSGATAFTVNYTVSTSNIGQIWCEPSFAQLTYGEHSIRADSSGASITASRHGVSVSDSALQVATDGLIGLQSVEWVSMNGRYVLAKA